MLGRESGFPFSSAPKFGNALCYSESDMVSLTTEHLIYILVSAYYFFQILKILFFVVQIQNQLTCLQPMNLGNVATYDVIQKKERITRDIGTTRGSSIF
jgi:hypothetical protein